VPADGIYTFTVNSCDGSKLYIDGSPVVEWDGVHSPGDKSGWVGLKAGLHAVNLPYFYDYQIAHGIGLASTLTVSYSGPGFGQTKVPLGSWYRVPSPNEPTVALTSPADGTTVCGSNVTFAATVTTNGAALSINRVQYYVGDYLFGTDTMAPYGLNQFLWASPGNVIRARMFYNGTNVVDSAANLLATTNMDLTPWSLAVVGEHFQPVGARVQGSTYSLIGDGLNLLNQQVSGDCTVVAHVAGLTSIATPPDGQTAESSWEAGIMLRANTNGTPGAALGNSNAKYAAAFKQLDGSTHFEDSTMTGTMGAAYTSPNLGSSYSWFKIQRLGDTFTTSVSANGVNWLPVNTNAVAGIGTVLNVGIFTYDATSDNPNVFMSTLDNVSITGNILSPPSVSVTPAATTAYTGQSATFTALPSGTPPFTYRWQYNGANISGATNATLTVTNLHPGNSGLYQVSLTTSNGTAMATAALTVLSPPSPAQVLSPLADAYVYGNSPNNNYGSETNLFVKTNGLAYARDAYLKFNVSGLTNAQSVILQLMPISMQSSPTLGFDLAANDAWTESGITWANQPGGTGIVITNVSGFTVGVPALVDVTSQTLSQAAQDGLLSLHIYSAIPGSSQIYFGSRDNALLTNQPQLVVITNPPAVTLTSPTSGAGYSSPATVNLSAGVSALGHTVNWVQFYNGTNLLGQVTNAPYTYTWANVAPGLYTVYAQAAYDGTNTVTSIPAFIRVVPLPSVPAGLTATALAVNLVNLAWTAATNATSYTLNCNGSDIATVSGTNYLDFGPTADLYPLCYSVVANNTYGSSGPSASSCVDTPPGSGALEWDAGGVSAGAQDGNGNWGGSSVTWWDSVANGAWSDGSLALFGVGTTTNCTVTITNDVTPTGIMFNPNAGGTYTLSASGGGINLSGNPTIYANQDATIAAGLKGSGALNLTGTGTLTLLGTNTYSGATGLSGGALVLGGTGQLGAGSYASRVTNNGALVFASSAAQSCSGVISGAGTLSLQGSGTLTLSGANTYSGGTTLTVSGDVTGLVVANAWALGTGPVLVNGGQHYSSSFSVNGGLSVTNALTLKRGGSGSSRATFGLGSGSTWSGPITVDNSSASGYAFVSVSGSSSTPSIISGRIGYSTLGVANSSNPTFCLRGGNYGKVTGPVALSTGYLQLIDTSKIEFSNAANVWGTLDIANASAIAYVGAPNTLSPSGIVFSSSGGTLQLNNLAGTTPYSQTIAGLNGNVKVGLSTGSATLALSPTVNQFHTNVISGPISLVANGPATQTLCGTNTYSGNTTINAGTLALGTTGSIGSSPNIVIAGNATFDVSAPASFAFTGASPVQKLASGSPSGTANINATGRTVTLNPGAQLYFQAGSNSVGRISVTGNVTLSANAVTIDVSGSSLVPGTYRLLDCTGALINNGTFGAPAIAGVPLLGSTASISVNTGTGGHLDLVVQKLPQPVIVPGASVSGGNFNLQFTGTPGQHYRVEYTPALPASGPWQVVTDVLSLASSPFVVSMPATNAAGFYRVGWVP
jgi:autotransporter-associated beta strand protein